MCSGAFKLLTKEFVTSQSLFKNLRAQESTRARRNYGNGQDATVYGKMLPRAFIPYKRSDAASEEQKQRPLYASNNAPDSHINIIVTFDDITHIC